jgi:hypothetical protein
MCHRKVLLIYFMKINRKRNNGKLTRLDSKVFQNDADSTRLEQWFDTPIPE